MQLFGGDESGHDGAHVLGVSLILAAFLINLSMGNRLIQGVASFHRCFENRWASSFSDWWESGSLTAFQLTSQALVKPEPWVISWVRPHWGYWRSKALQQSPTVATEVKNPKRNVGRAIVISIAACVVIYTLVGFAVASNLSLAEIIETRDYSLAAAARPALGDYGVWFTVAIAIMATAGGILASIFAVSRMLAMLTEMKLVPHRHFGMPGSIQKHTLVYTVVLGLVLTAFFDLSRIAALGIVFYLIMDIAIHWGVIRYLREDIKARAWIPVIAIFLDLLALGGFVWVKVNSDPFVIGVAVVTMIIIAIAEQIFLKSSARARQKALEESHTHHH